jgi:uncharacterized glyoxalase superfamily protein PhnB
VTASAPPSTTELTTTPYLCVHDGAAAIDWYVEAFGAVEQLRVVGDDGLLGHAELTVGTARFMLSDEHPASGVVSPRTLGGTAVAIHLEVADVDATYARAVGAGASVVTQDPQAVWERCQTAGVDVIREPQEPHHDPGGMTFSVRDPEGNAWSFGSYVGGATS